MSATPAPTGRGSGPRPDRLWTAAARTSFGLGLVCALIAWGAWVPVYGAIAAATLAILMAPHSGGPGIRRPVMTSVQVVAAVVATCGLIAALGWAGLVWTLVVAATHPAVGRWLSRGLGGDASSEPDADAGSAVPPGAAVGPVRERLITGPPPELPSPESLRRLDDEALCQAWRRSFVQLAASSLPTRRLELVGLRQLYLDELARRHPAAVQRWLASGARAASNPMPFVEQPTRGVETDASWPGTW